jgi:hypothetical protein
MILMILTEKTICDRCGSSKPGKGTFFEYPDGCGISLGQRVDLCDRCAQDGYVGFNGKIVLEEDIPTQGIDIAEFMKVHGTQ